MRQTHVGGDKLFVDYAGDTVPIIIDRLTGKMRPAQIFVAVLGASNFTYAEASWTQALADWIGAHTRAFAVIGGVPNLLVPDNTKVAVIKACLYEPQVNRTYAEMAAHYDTAILPARPRRPRDKAKVEAAVLIVERWLLGRLRHRRFYSLAELNAAIGELLRQLNDERPIRRLGVTRRALLDELDRPCLKALPSPMPMPNGGCPTDQVGREARSCPAPSAGCAGFPAEARLVLKPDLHGRPRVELCRDLANPLGTVFLNPSIRAGSCPRGRGRAERCRNPSRRNCLPIDAPDRHPSPPGLPRVPVSRPSPDAMPLPPASFLSRKKPAS